MMYKDERLANFVEVIMETLLKGDSSHFSSIVLNICLSTVTVYIST